MLQAFLKKWWGEADFKAPNLPLSLRFKGSGCHYNSIRSSGEEMWHVDAYQILYYSRGIEKAKRTRPRFADWAEPVNLVLLIIIKQRAINNKYKVLFRVDTYHNIHKTQALQSFSNRLAMKNNFLFFMGWFPFRFRRWIVKMSNSSKGFWSLIDTKKQNIFKYIYSFCSIVESSVNFLQDHSWGYL